MTLVRGHNEGTIFRRRQGRDAGVWVSAVTMRDGRRVSRTSHSRDDAKAELAELLRLRDANAPITERIRLGDYLERWLDDDHDWAPATRRKHVSVVRTHTRGLAHLRLHELSVADINGLLRGLVGSGQTRRHVRATLRRALADALRSGLAERNVAALANAPKLHGRERTVLDATQARTLIESTRDTRYGPLWAILLTTGLRISEALGLAWSDVDFGGRHEDAGMVLDAVAEVEVAAERRGIDARHRGLPTRHRGSASERRDAGRTPSITVRHQLTREDGKWVRRKPKTEKGRRTIPLTPLGVEALRAQRAMQDTDLGNTPRPIDGLVFTSPTGHYLHGTNTLKVLYADLDAAGLPKVTQHDLRHSCATILFGMGVPIEVIADILGHSTSRITADLYRHRVPELQREAAERMQEALG